MEGALKQSFPIWSNNPALHVSPPPPPISAQLFCIQYVIFPFSHRKFFFYKRRHISFPPHSPRMFWTNHRTSKYKKRTETEIWPRILFFFSILPDSTLYPLPPTPPPFPHPSHFWISQVFILSFAVSSSFR